MLALRRHGRSFFAKAVPFTWTLALAAGALLLALLPALAHAQAAVDPLTGPVTAPDTAKTIALALDYLSKHQWWPLLSLALSVAVWAVRDGLLVKLPGRAGVFFGTHNLVGFALPFALSGLAGWVTSMSTGQPWTGADLLTNVVKIAGTAIAMYVGMQHTKDAIGAPVDAAPAQAAGVEAAKDPGKTLGQ